MANDDKFFTAVNGTVRFMRMHRRLIESKVGELGLPRTSHRALMYLSKKERLPSQKELACHLELTPAAVTGILQRLEADGYIKRTLGTDNRFNEIEITEKGRNTVKRSQEFFKEIDSAMFSGFTDAEMELYTAFLDRITKNAERELSSNELSGKEKCK